MQFRTWAGNSGRRLRLGALLGLLAPGGLAGADPLLTPREFLGFDPCSEGAVIDSGQAASYLRHAAARSDHVRIETLGLSVEGRPILCALVSSPQNLARLDEIRTRRDRLFALVTCAVHPLEVGTTPAGLELLHRWITGASLRAPELLEEAVILLIPCLNPDGTDRVASWLRSSASADAGGFVPFPQHRFTGHDLNRDWLLGTQPETRAVIEGAHNRFRPWLTIDLHEMSSNGPRLFIPPYADPVDPSISPDLLEQTERLGGRVLERLTQSGRRGAARRWTYDAWSPSRAYPLYHGGLRFLVEVAAGELHRSVDLDERALRVFGGGNDATKDHPAPWRGGKWGLPQITDYLIAASELALEAMLEEPLRSGQSAHWKLAGERQAMRLEGSGADPDAAGELRRALELGGVELRLARDGSGWIAIDPPWGRGWCSALLDCKPYPAGGILYDAASHDLAQLAGLRASPASPVDASAAALPPPVPRIWPASRARSPRIQLLESAGSASDEGWLRWALEENRFELERISCAEIETRETEQGSRRVIIATAGADGSMEACAEKLLELARSGSRVILIGRIAQRVAALARLPVDEAAAAPGLLSGTLLRTRFSSAGARDSVIAGYASPPPVFLTDGPLFKVPAGSAAEAILSIDGDRPVLCGGSGPSPPGLDGLSPLVRVKEARGGGEWILFGFSPSYRAWTTGAFRLLSNAILAP